MSFYGGSLEDAKTAANENYAGSYKTVSDFAEQLTEETTEIPEKLSYYIDYYRMGAGYGAEWRYLHHRNWL